MLKLTPLALGMLLPQPRIAARNTDFQIFEKTV
jgi:hypothetical protein